MDDYWDALSDSHRSKVTELAAQRKMPVDRAFRNILRQIAADLNSEAGSAKQEGMLTIRQIESALDAMEL
jgi:hypothetical protein